MGTASTRLPNTTLAAGISNKGEHSFHAYHVSNQHEHDPLMYHLQLGFGLRLQLHTGTGASSKSQEDKSQLLILYGRLVIIMSTFSAAFGEYDIVRMRYVKTQMQLNRAVSTDYTVHYWTIYPIGSLPTVSLSVSPAVPSCIEHRMVEGVVCDSRVLRAADFHFAEHAGHV